MPSPNHVTPANQSSVFHPSGFWLISRGPVFEVRRHRPLTKSLSVSLYWSFPPCDILRQGFDWFELTAGLVTYTKPGHRKSKKLQEGIANWNQWQKMTQKLREGPCQTDLKLRDFITVRGKKEMLDGRMNTQVWARMEARETREAKDVWT